jgi:Flp pilus assembly protein TadD
MRGVALLGILLFSLLFSCTRTVSTATYAPPAAKGSLPATMRRQVLNAVDAGEGDVKARQLRQRLAAQPDSLDIRLELAAHYNTRGVPELALEHYRLAAERFPASEEAVLGTMRMLRSQGQLALAAGAVEEFIRRNPQDRPDLLSWLGILKDQMGRSAEAEKAHRAAMALSPHQDYLHNNLGYNLFLQGRLAEAEQEFRLALQANRTSQIARNNLATVLVDKPKEALMLWTSAGDPASAHNNLAVQYIRQGKWKEAREELETALQYRKDLPEVVNNLRLVSEVDGRAITLAQHPNRTCWQRFTSRLKKAFVANEETTAPVSVAERH